MSERKDDPGVRAGWLITPVELVVVVLVIGILIGMLLPAVSRVRTAARKTQSANNLRQIVLAALNYESANTRFPAFNNRISNGTEDFGWGAAVFSFIESNNIIARTDENESWDSIENSFVLSRAMPYCSSPFEGKLYDSFGFGVLQYAACFEFIGANKGIAPDDDFDWSQFTFGEICDGYEPWPKPGSCRQYSDGIRFDATSFGSPRLDGALMARANGKVEFVSSAFTRPKQSFEGKREQGAHGRPDSFGYEVGFEYSPLLGGWRADCRFHLNTKGFRGGKAIDDPGLAKICQQDGVVALELGGDHLVSGAGLASIRDCGLSRLKVGQRQAIEEDDLSALHGMPQLKHVVLRNGEFPKDTVEQLRLALPDCKVVVR